MIGRARQKLLSSLLWAAFAVLLLVGAEKMLGACDLSMLPIAGAASCTSPINHRIQMEAERGDKLRANLHAAEINLAQLPICLPPPPPIKPPQSVKPPETTKLSPPKQNEKLTIPKQAVDLQGCWRSARGDIDIYLDSPGHENKPVGTARFCYCFGNNGQGTARLRYSNGDTCIGPLVARLNSDSLMMRHEDLSCTGKTYKHFTGQEIVCSNTDNGETICRSRSLSKHVIIERVEQYVRAAEEECNW